MAMYNTYDRGSPEPAGRSNGRDRDDYRDDYRERRRSPDRRRDRERDRDRDRRRSRSPNNIDRYQPERSFRDDYRSSRDIDEQRRRSPIDRNRTQIDRYVPGEDSPAPAHNPLPDPAKVEFQVGFNYYAEWWRVEQRIQEDKARRQGIRPERRERSSREEQESEKSRIQAAYDQYKEVTQAKQAATFIRQHKTEDWFKERYIPDIRDARRSKLLDYRRELYSDFHNALTSGDFDDFTLEGIHKADSNGQGGTIEKEEGETVAAAEVLQTGDLVPSFGGDMRDHNAQQPTLLIKTIAPTVTREKLEAFAKEHLGEGPGGFRHLSLSDPNPSKKWHRMGWIILKDGGEDLVDDDMIVEGVTENGEEAEKKVTKPTTVAERALQKIDGKTVEDPENGNFTVHCGIHRPPDAPRKKALWDLFSAPERVRADLDLATRLVRKLDNELGEQCFGGAMIAERVEQLQNAGRLRAVKPSKPVKDFDIMDDIVEDGEEEGAIDEDEYDDEDLLVVKKKLDLLVEYLRRVYSFCFFCVFESDSVHELQRKCPGGHLRRPRASLTTIAKEVAIASARGQPFPFKQGRKGDEDYDMAEPDSPVEERNSFAKPAKLTIGQSLRAFNWVKTFEEKALQLLEPENANLKKLGGIPLEEGLDQELKKFVQQEDVSKYRCMAPGCTKLFKGVDFWRKHVAVRHTDFYDSIVKDLELVNTYVLDPSHIAPSRSDANSNGHFPITNPGMPTGTPRGFSLSQLMPAAGGLPAFSGAPYGMPGFVMPAIGVGQHYMPGIGPMRTQGHRGGNSYRAPGPYARNAGPPGRAIDSGLPGRPPNMGPREATQGRAIRSYEDLDAVVSHRTIGAEAVELDY